MTTMKRNAIAAQAVQFTPLMYIRPRQPHDSSVPETSTSIPTSTGSLNQPIPSPIDTNTPGQSPSIPPFTSDSSQSSTQPGNGGPITFTSSFPSTTATQPITTLTSSSEAPTFISSSNTIPIPTTPTNSVPFTTATALNSTSINSQPICIGDGLDSSSEGLLASVILPSAVGLVLWLLFAIIRPRFRQIYGLREWFIQQDLRPKPLGSSFFAFLFPHVPLVPPIPSDTSSAGRSRTEDAKLFPSDEQLNQRALWISFLIVLGWTILGLGGALPLYLVRTSCIAQAGSPAVYGGAYSTLQDLSVMRLLRLFDDGTISTSNLSELQARADPVDSQDPQHARVRIIILTIFVLVLGVLPALWKIIKEFNTLVAYRKSFTDIRCEGKELGWLSASQAPGFVGWGEKRLKEFILKTGLSLSMEARGERNSNRGRNGRQRTRRAEEQPLNYNEEANLEIDIQTLFSIGDTQALALLIDERDEILENLEIAETRYIGSFRITTPDPSIADYEPPRPADPNRPYISRPLPLVPGTRRGRRRAINPAFAASSLAPTSFVAPSQYYKLHSVQGVSGGRFTDSGIDQQPSLSDSINSRVIGSRFLEVNRNSVAYGRLPLGSQVIVEKSGQLGPRSALNSFAFSATIPDPRRFGPNYGVESSDVTEVNENEIRNSQEGDILDDEWVDLTRDAPLDLNSDFNGQAPAGPSFMRQPKKESVPSARRETFPLREGNHAEPGSSQPPHLRLQPVQPFVRPQDGLNFDDLGQVYADITQWRSRLKMINAEIANAQGESYNDIADGARIKGWLMVGRGVRYIPGIQLIEGRAKEDIRWDVLQNERGFLVSIVMWAVIGVVTILLAAGLTAASGLALANAPDVAHYFPFLERLLGTDPLAAGIATVLVPAVAATLFISLALIVINWVVHIYGSISVSGGHLMVFKITFFILTIVAALWLITVGALLFSLRAFTFNSGMSQSVANGSIYMSILVLSVIINAAIIFPALLLLQPFRLWRVIRAERQAITPRQRFRAVYPRTYNPSFATGACVLAIVFASTFSLIFPLIGPAVTILLLLTLVAHRYLVGYVYARTHSQTGGLLQIWLLKRLGTLLSLQPILLGLIFLSRKFWIEGGVLIGSGVGVIIFVEIYASLKTRLPGRKSLSPITQDSLQTFERTAKAKTRQNVDGEGTSYNSSGRGGIARTRGSIASVLEMMSLTLAVMPSTSIHQGPVPLQTETLDDLTATERAARTHPDAPPHLPPLPFTDHAEEMAGILYAPELIAPPPIIWLPNDSAGVARSEAVDLQKYHDLQVTLDVRTKEDVMPRRSSSSRGRTS